MNLAPYLRQQFLYPSTSPFAGTPIAGGKLWSYVAGTTTPQTSYSNAGGTANTNPVILDSNGYCDLWLDPSLAYKFKLLDPNDVQLWTVDSVVFSLGIAAWSANQTYQQGQIVQDASGQGLLYVSLTNANINNPLTSASNWRVFAGNVRSVSTSVTLLVTDDLVRSNSTAGNLTLTLPACATTPIGKKITVKDVGTGGNTTTIKGSGTDNVDGNNTYASTLSLYDSVTFVNTGTSWDVMGVPANLAIGTAQLAAKAVTAAKIADATITATQIANATLTGAQVANNINLPTSAGNAVQANAKNVVVSQTNAASGTSLAVIRGAVSGAGAIISGEGFVVTRNATGDYTLAWSTEFPAAPIVVVTAIDPTNTYTAALKANPTTSGAAVATGSASTPTDVTFDFIAIGTR